MARVLSLAGNGIAEAERVLLARFKALDDDWIVLEGVTIETAEESGRVDFVLLNDRLGIVVAAALAPGEEASVEEGALALRAMLDQRGVSRGFGGAVPIVGLALDPAGLRDPETVLRRAFDPEPPLTAERGWSRRVAALLAPETKAPTRRGSLELRAESEDSWRVAREQRPAATRIEARVTPEEHVPAETVPKSGATLWAGMAVAVVVMGGVLAGMAALNHGSIDGRATAAVASGR